MRVYDMEQRSPEWHAIRKGVITGTRVKEVFASNNLKLVDKLIGEKYSDADEDMISSAAIQRGIDLEPHARREYERYTGLEVDDLGFVLHADRDWHGHSPDGMVKVNSKHVIGIEIKCPNTSTHVRYIRMNKLPAEYRHQVYNMFLVNPDIERVDFISYDNRFTIKPIHIIPIHRADVQVELDEIDAGLVAFMDKMNKYEQLVTF